MKIAFLTPEFPHPKTGASGGIGTSIKNLTGGLTHAGHAPVVLVYGQDKDESFTENGLTVYRIKNVKIKGLSWYLTRKKIEKLINRLYDDQKIDVVEAPDWTGITSFIRPKCPVVIRLNGSDTYFCHLDNRPVKKVNRFHEKRALENADALLSVSQYTAEVTNELFALGRDFTVIPNGVDASAFAPSVSAESNQILYFGTLIRKKGLLELPYIFNELHRLQPDVKLILVGRDASDITSGNPSTWEMMRPLFDESALANVDYRGSMPYEKIRECIGKAAVCVFPTFAEALPVSWIEAMAMGKAVVASDIGWATEVIEDAKSGFLVHPTNHTLYAKRISDLLTDHALREKTGAEARARVMTHFDMRVVAKQNIDYYQRLLTPNQ
jgi:glycosyltransferase involved in cell wall biosynthesis